MTPLALLRHGPTPWNAERRLQGRADVALGERARLALAQARLPAQIAEFRCLVSPLVRCLETARLLGCRATIDPRLIEMDWGKFEGRSLDELRRELGGALAENEARGLDFTPPDGESPRAVQTRIAPLLVEIAAARQATLAITHRGVIRAIYARAVGWDMTGRPPHILDLYAIQLFALAPDGVPSIARLNLKLGAST